MNTKTIYLYIVGVAIILFLVFTFWRFYDLSSSVNAQNTSEVINSSKVNSLQFSDSKPSGNNALGLVKSEPEKTKKNVSKASLTENLALANQNPQSLPAPAQKLVKLIEQKKDLPSKDSELNDHLADLQKSIAAIDSQLAKQGIDTEITASSTDKANSSRVAKDADSSTELRLEKISRHIDSASLKEY